MSATWTLAITGKGGVGKTTLAALAVRWLCERGSPYRPVLAVDADPNTSLDTLLGVQVTSAVGTVREEVKQLVQTESESVSRSGMGKQQLLEMKIQQSLIEADDFDVIAMGRPEGPGCYCYANNVLSAAIGRLAANYSSVVIDNEAGLENLSRRIVQRVDQLLLVTDPSERGLSTARRLYDLAVEMEIEAGAMGLVINRARSETNLDHAAQRFNDTPVVLVGSIPEDAELRTRDEQGEPILTLPASNPAVEAVSAILDRITPDRPV